LPSKELFVFILTIFKGVVFELADLTFNSHKLWNLNSRKERYLALAVGVEGRFCQIKFVKDDFVGYK